MSGIYSDFLCGLFGILLCFLVRIYCEIFCVGYYYSAMERSENSYVRVYDITDKGFLYLVRKVQVKSRVECTNCFAVFPKCLFKDPKQKCYVCGHEMRPFC